MKQPQTYRAMVFFFNMDEREPLARGKLLHTNLPLIHPIKTFVAYIRFVVISLQMCLIRLVHCLWYLVSRAQ